MKAINKEFHREIRRSFSRFISILLIVALGVAFYSGIRSTEPDMRATGDRLYDKSNMMDIKVVSTLGLSDFDVSKIEELEGIEKVCGSYSQDVIAKTNGHEHVVTFMSAISGINDVVIKEGRNPSGETECIVDTSYLKEAKLKIGDTIQISSGSKNTNLKEIFARKKFIIVGSFTSSQFISNTRASSKIGNGRVSGLAIVDDKAFVTDGYTEIYARVKGAKEENCYEKKYQNLVNLAKDSIETKVKDLCIQTKYQELYQAATDVMDGIQSQIDAQKKGIKKAEKKIQKKQESIQELEGQVPALDAEIASYQTKIDVYDKFINQYSSMGYVPAGNLNTYDVPMEQLEREKQQLVDKQTPYQTQKDQILTQVETLNTDISNLENDIALAKDTITGLQEELDLATDARDEIQSPNWTITDRNQVSGYVEFDQDASRIARIATVFPIIFFLVAAFVSLSTMTRMVTEERTNIGTLKALGYSKLKISAKYLKYALWATLLGSIIGGVVGVQCFPAVILSAYRLIYPGLGSIKILWNLEYSLVAAVIAILVVLVATIFATSATMKETPAVLMRPKSPKAGKKILLEYLPFVWKHLTFQAKSSIRNLVRYKRRFFMTLFGISGCMALIIVGFGLKDSSDEIIANQYGKIFLYSGKVAINGHSNEKRQNEMSDFFQNDGRIVKSMKLAEQTITVKSKDQKEEALLLCPEDADLLANFVSLKSPEGEGLSLGTDGVIIDEKFALLGNLSVGDEIRIACGEKEEVSVKISGIAHNYMEHYVFISKSLYQSLFAEEPLNNLLYFNAADQLSNKERVALGEEILSLRACQSASWLVDEKTQIKSVLESISIIVIVLILSAAGLAFVVLYNLNNINISERKRELATLKVLGFYNREVENYITRENVQIMFWGIASGCILGYFLHRFVIVRAELDMMLFGRTIQPLSYVYAGLLTLAFAILINFTMSFRIKKINMAESMKTVE